MLENNKSLPAFPRPKQILGSGEDYHEIPATDGLSKREWFAGMALQGLLANTHVLEELSTGQVAEQATIVADALLFELSKPQP